MPDAAPVGLIGLGLLGEALASRLLAAGFPVAGFDIDAGRVDRLTAAGVVAAGSAAAVAQSSEIIVLALFDTGQVERVVAEQLLPAIGDGPKRTVICTSTCDPDRIAALAKTVELQGLQFLEVPVSGTSEQVRRGEGIGLIGGDREIAVRVAPIIDAMLPRSFHIGPVGDGGRAKLAINLILGLNRMALAEGLVFAGRLGLDPAKFLEIARESAACSQVMDTKGPKMVAGDFAPEGRARQTLKDVHLMLEQARIAGQQLPLLEVHAEVLEACLRMGEGDRDNSIVIAEIKRRSRDGLGEHDKRQ
jgi:3-hydroxyisobutyrate dehydrogenase-like beta-hydroxyacid dehydrogenase